MSWQTYIDDHLMAPLPHGGQLAHAAIVGQDGGVWAQSESFPEITEKEVADIVKGFTDTGSLAQSGLYVGGTKYLVVTGEEGTVIRGKKGPAGVTIRKTNSALVIGIYGEGAQPGEANVAVENMGDYLVGQGI
ncbi:hypothetical protein WJX72_005251 [[Myrmecia] bisecta]|uniref:Profilin n=1 Tax=[Myrmecia] bisecta TaxID=41462 RepID=A0AAW1PWX8_9CHLO